MLNYPFHQKTYMRHGDLVGHTNKLKLQSWQKLETLFTIKYLLITQMLKNNNNFHY